MPFDTSNVEINGRLPEGSKKTVPVGTRVEIHPSYDLWMQGARYGVIKGRSGESGLVALKMDNPNIKGTRYFPASDLFEV